MQSVYEEPELPAFLRGGCRVLSCLGAGGERSVYLIEDLSGKKYILKKAVGEEAALLKKEARQMETHDFSFLPRFFCFQEEDGASYLLRGYIEGDTLEELVERDGAMSVRRAGGIAKRLCEISAKLHSQEPPLVHRDIKPSNIVLTPEGNLFLIDFGTVREYNPDLSRDTEIIGTRGTAAPEQYGFCQTDARTDIYALGVTYCYLLTGEVYGRGRKAYDDLPWECRQIIEKCTELDPQERYQTDEQLKSAIGAVSAGNEKIHFGIKQFVRRRKKSARLSKIIAFLAVVLAGVSLMAVYRANYDYSFHSELIEEAVRRQLEKNAGERISKKELLSIEVLRICGGEILSEEDRHWQYCTAHRINGEKISGRGQIRDLKDIRHMKNLRELVLDRQQISDISALKGLKLETLSLCDNPLKDLSPLSGNDTLKELSLEQTQLESLTELENLKTIQILDIGMTPVDSLEPIKNLKVEKLYMASVYLRKGEKIPKMALTKLVLHNQLEELIYDIGEKKNLEELTIYNYGFETLKPLFDLKNLKKLDLYGGRINNLEGIDGFTKLEELIIGETQIRDISLLGKLKKLYSLGIEYSQVKDMSVLGELDGLRRLSCDTGQKKTIDEILPEPLFEIHVSEMEE